MSRRTVLTVVALAATGYAAWRLTRRYAPDGVALTARRFLDTARTAASEREAELHHALAVAGDADGLDGSDASVGRAPEGH